MKGPATKIRRPRYCRALRDANEVVAAVTEARKRGLCPSPDARKAWDSMIAVELITAHAAKDEPVADIGCRSGILLTWLYELGYFRLHGCDIRLPFPPLKAALRRRLWRTAIDGLRMYATTWRRLLRRPAEATTFPGNTFAALSCVSVVEHGLDMDKFLAEAARLLRPGGVLFLSTDYWPQKIDLGPSKLFEESRGFDEIFSLEEVHSLVVKAAGHGLHLLEEPDLEADDPIIHDRRASYTFLALAFTLEADARSGPTQLRVKGN